MAQVVATQQSSTIKRRPMKRGGGTRVTLTVPQPPTPPPPYPLVGTLAWKDRNPPTFCKTRFFDKKKSLADSLPKRNNGKTRRHKTEEEKKRKHLISSNVLWGKVGDTREG